jgi:hypothetical protein
MGKKKERHSRNVVGPAFGRILHWVVFVVFREFLAAVALLLSLQGTVSQS